MSDVHRMHTMTLAEANRLLASIGYDERWSTAALIDAIDEAGIDHREFAAALRIAAAACQAEANELRAYVASRHRPTPDAA